MKKYLVVLLSMLGLISSAYALTGSWSKTTTHYTIYLSGGYATMPFGPPTSVPISGTSIMSVAYTWTPYANGNTSEIVELCYSEPYSSIIGNCTNISAARSGTSSGYNGKSARGKFWIRHTINGGTYPAISTTTDSVTVTYNY